MSWSNIQYDVINKKKKMFAEIATVFVVFKEIKLVEFILSPKLNRFQIEQ